jgi:glycerol-3-phosphate dehydrogenase (NAD(P)+)
MLNKGITVLGAGSWGTALAIHLARNDNTTCLWGHEPGFMNQLAQERQNRQYLPGFEFPETLDIESSLEAAMKTGRDVEVLTQLKPCLDKDSRVAWATKGLEHGSGKFMGEVFEDVLGDTHPSAVASGAP